MGEAQVIERTTEEIMARLRDAYPEQNPRVTVEPQEEEPHTATSEPQLVELLLEAVNCGTRHEVTEETWAYIRGEVHRRAAQRS